MIIVQKEHFQFIKTKVTEAPTFVYSILDGIIQGTVYADSTDYNTLLIHTDSGLHYVAGQPSYKQSVQTIVNIFDVAVTQGRRFTLFSPNVEWNVAIESCIAEQNVGKIHRYAFSFDEMTYKNSKGNHVSASRVSKINKMDIQHCLEFDNHYYNEYWGSVDNFIAKGIGFCVKDGERIISEAVSIFKSMKYAEIDIITDAHYRGQGLASIVAEQFIDDCLAKQIQPRWDCDIDNHASIKLGKNLGFTNPQQYAVYFKKSNG
ncbi:GNAT family N-acetyltransferase [Lysinibacillus sp. 38-6]|uniref:GNAT family N-acetyltransferase n=1 Tax=Lysinibacillus sp. 38-6 TaxID=3385991 RepID=UPI003908A4D1